MSLDVVLVCCVELVLMLWFLHYVIEES